MRSLACVSVVLAVLCSHPARADDAPSPADAAAIHDVISKQLDAFNAGDGATAESFASPGIRDKFPSPDAFMSMVKNAYGALIKPRSTHFDDITQTPLGVVQKVTFVASDGQVWTAAYTMQLVDGQWRISGCFMLKSEAVNA